MMLWVALMLAAGAAAQEIGSQCLPCHSEHVDDVRGHKHGAKGLSCEVCHGESEKHRKAVGAAPPDRVAAPDEVPALCGTCHAAQKQAYANSSHGKLVKEQGKARGAHCGSCHGTHAARWESAMEKQCGRCHAVLPQACKAQPAKANAKLACASCHEPHSLSRR